MDGVVLPPDLEQFAADAVAAGHYRDRSEVLAAGLGLLRQTQAMRARLRTSIAAAESNGERDGFLSIDEVLRDADAVLEEMAGQRR